MKNNYSYNLVLISTFIDEKNIHQLINSITINNRDLSILVVLINQTNNKLELPTPLLIDFIQINTERLSSSKARNVGINYLLKNNIKFSHIMFPDDDSSFSELFFSRFKEQTDEGKNYLIDVYCQGTNLLFKENKYQNGNILSAKNCDAAMMVNMIINYNTFKGVNFLDEKMGIGDKYGAGEDGDYFARACRISKNGFIYNKELYNFHPSSANKFAQMKLSQVISKYVNYGNGAIYMLCKHKMYFMALKICFRAIGGALISLFKLNFKLFTAYIIAFFSRFFMLFKCLLYAKKYYIND